MVYFSPLGALGQCLCCHSGSYGHIGQKQLLMFESRIYQFLAKLKVFKLFVINFLTYLIGINNNNRVISFIMWYIFSAFFFKIPFVFSRKPDIPMSQVWRSRDWTTLSLQPKQLLSLMHHSLPWFTSLEHNRYGRCSCQIWVTKLNLFSASRRWLCNWNST